MIDSLDLCVVILSYTQSQAIMTMQSDLKTTAETVQSTAVRLLAEYDHATAFACAVKELPSSRRGRRLSGEARPSQSQQKKHKII